MTPIQAAVDYFAAHTNDIPVSDRTIFVDSGTYNGNVSIDGISSLAILGSSKGTTPVIDGRVTILNSVGINLSNFLVNQGVLVDTSKNVALTNVAGKNAGTQPGIQVTHSDHVALTNITSDNGIQIDNSRDVSVNDDSEHAGHVGLSVQTVADLTVNTGGDAQVNLDARSVSGTTTVNGGAGSLTLSGWLDASDLLPGGVGGAVQILGDRISLDHMLIDVSGDAGGGSVSDWRDAVKHVVLLRRGERRQRDSRGRDHARQRRDGDRVVEQRDPVRRNSHRARRLGIRQRRGD